jgi:GT2 family glycosyltransferase
MSNNELTYIVIVTWKGYEDTIKCLKSIENSNLKNTRVVVIDTEYNNAKHEDLKGKFRDKNIKFISIENNIGYAGANNIGIKFAINDGKCKYIWLLNNDTQINKDSLPELLKEINNPGVGMCGSTLVYMDDPNTVQSIGGTYNKFLAKGEHIGRGLNVSNLPNEKKVNYRIKYIMGASMLVTREFIEKVGVMNEEYFLYYEELDWIIRAKNKYSIKWAKKSIVVHREGSSVGTNSRGRSSNTAIYYSSVNSMRFTRNYYVLFLPIVMLKLVIATIFYIKSDRERSDIYRMAIRDFFSNRKRIGPISRLN